MNLSVLLITFGVIFVAELPDKTMDRDHRAVEPVPAAAGVDRRRLRHGRELHGGGPGGTAPRALPHRWVEGAVAMLFTGGSLYLLLVKEETETPRGREGSRQGPLGKPRRPGSLRQSSCWPSSET